MVMFVLGFPVVAGKHWIGILFPSACRNKIRVTERGGSVVTHETRIREVPVQIPWPANLVEVFSGFVNLKIAKELVIFKDKCRVGPHIPLQMYKFNVSQDLKPLLLTKW